MRRRARRAGRIPLVHVELNLPDSVRMVLFVLVFGGIGLYLLWFSLDTVRHEGFTEDVGLFLGVGTLFFVIALVALVAFLGHRREERADRGVTPVIPADATALGLPQPWPVRAVAETIAAALQGRPYRVQASEEAIAIERASADAQWQALATSNALPQMREVTLVAQRAGRFTRRDHGLRMASSLGRLAGTGRAGTTSGRTWSYRREVQLGTGHQGVDRAIDIEDSTQALDAVIADVLRRSGWQARMGANARGALLTAGIAVLGVLITPLVFLIRWLVGAG